MCIEKCFQYCYHVGLSLPECRKLLEDNGYGYWSDDCMADKLEEMKALFNVDKEK